MTFEVIDGQVEKARARPIRIAEDLHPRARQYLPFDQGGHWIVVGRAPEQRRVPALALVDVRYWNNGQYMFYRHGFTPLVGLRGCDPASPRTHRGIMSLAKRDRQR